MVRRKTNLGGAPDSGELATSGNTPSRTQHLTKFGHPNRTTKVKPAGGSNVRAAQRDVRRVVKNGPKNGLSIDWVET